MYFTVFSFVHSERQVSDRVHKSEEPVSFVSVSFVTFVKGNDTDNRLPRIKGDPTNHKIHSIRSKRSQYQHYNLSKSVINPKLTHQDNRLLVILIQQTSC